MLSNEKHDGDNDLQCCVATQQRLFFVDARDGLLLAMLRNAGDITQNAGAKFAFLCQ